MVRARLITINEQAVRDAVSKEARSDNALNRELNLTWSLTLQDDNHIVSGRWWHAADEGRALVSVESKLAERLAIRLGDELGFSLGGETFSAKVTSIRTVQWDSFRPNFYMVFPPGVLENYAATYMTSFYLPASDKAVLIELVRRFPALTVLEMDLIIRQVERIFRQVTLAVEYVLLFVLLYEGALLRALGGSRRQLRAGHLAEFAALGVLAGLVAAIGTECLAWLLYSQVMQLDYTFKWQVWLAAPLSGALLIGAAGYWGTRAVVERSPMHLLRDRSG
jgi:putative ABC transport system permease protein